MFKLGFSLVILFFGIKTFAGNPPFNYPAVNGIVKKIDLSNKQVTLKHETIPNLNMPGMTMPFTIKDLNLLQGIQIGDKVRFAADETNEGDLEIIWIEKAQINPAPDLASVQCSGIAETAPNTKIEIDIFHNTFSTIRYEITEGSLKGSSHINSLGRMKLTQNGSSYIYHSEEGASLSTLSFEVIGSQIKNEQFYKYNSKINFNFFHCRFGF